MGEIVDFTRERMNYMFFNDEFLGLSIKDRGCELLLSSTGAIDIEEEGVSNTFYMAPEKQLNLMVSFLAMIDPDLLNLDYCQRKLGITELPCKSTE